MMVMVMVMMVMVMAMTILTMAAMITVVMTRARTAGTGGSRLAEMHDTLPNWSPRTASLTQAPATEPARDGQAPV